MNNQKIFISYILVIVVLLFNISLSQETIRMELNEGYNKYQQLNHYYRNYQKVSISDLSSHKLNTSYHFCYISQSTKQSLLIKQTQYILSSQQNKDGLNTINNNVNNQSLLQSKVLYDIQDLLSSDKIVDSYWDQQKQIIYLLMKKELKLVKITNNKIDRVLTTIQLDKQIVKGTIIQLTNYNNNSNVVNLPNQYNKSNNKRILIVSQFTVYQIIKQTQSIIKLKPIIVNKQLQKHPIISAQPLYSNNFNELIIFNQKSIMLFNISNSNSNNNNNVNNLNTNILISKINFNSYQNYQINNLYYYHQQNSSSLLLLFDQSNTYFNNLINLTSSQPIDLQNLYTLPQANKCTKPHIWHQHYLFLQCQNHLVYFKINQLLQCNSNKYPHQIQLLSCIQSIKPNHVNLGYHIQKVNFLLDSRLLITSYDKYQIKYIQTKLTDSSIQQITNIYSLNTFYSPSLNINQVYLLSSNVPLLISKTSLSVGRHIQQNKQLFCKTVDQNTHASLNQPSGYYNGTLSFEGYCLDTINQSLNIQQINQHFCRTQVPVLVVINSQIQQYQFLYYILAGIIIFILIIIIIYFILKKYKLHNQYKLFEDEKEHGQHVLQQTMVTQPDKEQYKQQNIQN